MQIDFEQFIQQLPQAKTFWVAYSGGLDSHVLLHSLSQYLQNDSIQAVHVNHHLQAAADDWQRHCQAVCEELNVPLTFLSIDINPQKGESLEALARQLRYQAFEDLLEQHDVLLTAHHQDDQAETVLLQLLRGAGPKGLAAMPLHTRLGTGTLARPLLNYTRQQINTYAELHQLHWIEDASNKNTDFDRNYLRQHIMPIIKKRWPQQSKTISRSAVLCSQADELLTEMAASDYQTIATAEHRLFITQLAKLDEARQANLIRYWLLRQELPLPSQKKMQQIIKTVIPAREDAKPCVDWAGAEVRRYRNHLYASKPLQFPEPNYQQFWDLQQPLILPANLGTLTAKQVTGQGIVLPKGAVITVRFNRQGARCKIAGRQGTKPLKKWYQEWGVPPWQRARIPLLFVDGDLVAVIGHAVCEAFSVTDSQQIGWLVMLNPCSTRVMLKL